MNVANDRLSILKKGSRTGNRWDPQSAVCSSICATPVLSIGVVRNMTLANKIKKKKDILKHQDSLLQKGLEADSKLKKNNYCIQ